MFLCFKLKSIAQDCETDRLSEIIKSKFCRRGRAELPRQPKLLFMMNRASQMDPPIQEFREGTYYNPNHMVDTNQGQ